jgi:GAF domain-containing protein
LVALLLISIAILFAGIAGTLVLMMRSGETRVAFLTLCFFLLATRQGFALWQLWDEPLAMNAGGAAEVALLGASAIGVMIVAALWQTLAERDRAEGLHWNSMEAVRILGELAARWDLSLDQKLDALLKTGCDRFDLEVGVVSRVEKQRYEVIAIAAPEGFPVARGAAFLLADTCCNRALTENRSLAFERVDDPAQLGHSDRSPLGFRAYLGTSVHVYGDIVGTLCFGSRSGRKRRFTATDKDLLNLMSQWVGTELERRFAVEERNANARREEAAAASPARADGSVRSIPRSGDVNTAIRRSDKTLRELAGPDIDIEYRLADDLRAAVGLRVAVGAIVESLVFEAAEALSEGDGGRVTIETANLEIAHRDPDVVPAIAPNHYVTIAVTAAGNGVAAESFTRAFEPDPAAAATAKRRGHDRLMTPAAIYRLLQRYGGDLSLEVEPGRGSTFTIFLPLASEHGVAVRAAPAASARRS